MNIYYLLQLVLWSFLFIIEDSKACVNVAIISARRKRPAENQAAMTTGLRYYFVTCMNTLVPSKRYDWQSNIDFSVLDSLWFLNTHQTYCSASSGGETKECWQGEIVKFLKGGSSRILRAAQTCIGHYAEDIEAEPPSNRYLRRRSKREVSHNALNFLSSSTSSSHNVHINFGHLIHFSKCLSSAMTYRSRRSSLNFINLSLFIGFDTRDSCGEKRTSLWSKNPSWAYRFIALTRPDSTLRSNLEACAMRTFPPVFYWSTWGRWGECSSSCSEGITTRKRTCRSAASSTDTSTECPGPSREHRICEGSKCGRSSSQHTFMWGPWTSYTSCSNSCGSGLKQRIRSCHFHGRNFNAAGYCSSQGGSSKERIRCQTKC